MMNQQEAGATWMVTLSTGVIVVKAARRCLAIKRAIQEEFIRLGHKFLVEKKWPANRLHVRFEGIRLYTWFDREMGYGIDFDDTMEG